MKDSYLTYALGLVEKLISSSLGKLVFIPSDHELEVY